MYKNKSLCSPGTQYGRRVTQVYFFLFKHKTQNSLKLSVTLLQQQKRNAKSSAVFTLDLQL